MMTRSKNSLWSKGLNLEWLKNQNLTDVPLYKADLAYNNRHCRRSGACCFKKLGPCACVLQQIRRLFDQELRLQFQM